jgi:hypothetical protein
MFLLSFISHGPSGISSHAVTTIVPSTPVPEITKEEKIAEALRLLGQYDAKEINNHRQRYEELVALVPENKDYKVKLAHYTKLNDAEIAKVAASNAREEAKNKSRKRQEGVSIEMSKEDVRASSWGRPNKVNATTTAYGTREQWVYGDYGQRGFLYFDGETLTAIQN